MVLCKLNVCGNCQYKTNKSKSPYVICNLHKIYESLNYKLLQYLKFMLIQEHKGFSLMKKTCVSSRECINQRFRHILNLPEILSIEPNNESTWRNETSCVYWLWGNLWPVLWQRMFLPLPLTEHTNLAHIFF